MKLYSEGGKLFIKLEEVVESDKFKELVSKGKGLREQILVSRKPSIKIGDSVWFCDRICLVLNISKDGNRFTIINPNYFESSIEVHKNMLQPHFVNYPEI